MYRGAESDIFVRCKVSPTISFGARICSFDQYGEGIWIYAEGCACVHPVTGLLVSSPQVELSSRF